jgi:ABC-2 type transport system ATP-binding protein
MRLSALADRIAVINRGRLVALGSLEELERRFPGKGGYRGYISPSNPPPNELSSLPGVLNVFEDAGKIELVVRDTETALESLAAYAKRRGLKIAFLHLKGADAEELFLRIVGDSS